MISLKHNGRIILTQECHLLRAVTVVGGFIIDQFYLSAIKGNS